MSRAQACTHPLGAEWTETTQDGERATWCERCGEKLRVQYEAEVPWTPTSQRLLQEADYGEVYESMEWWVKTLMSIEREALERPMVRKAIRGNHAAHATWPIGECVEPECVALRGRL